MITWLASYPKSGNTWLRALLTSYLYTSDGTFDFKTISKIYQFPSKKFFKNYSKSYLNIPDTAEFWIDAQIKINNDENFRVFKTHNAFLNVNNYNFTNKKNTNGCIYIARDPRNIITSITNHYEMNYEEALEWMINDKGLLFKKEGNQYTDFQFLSSWRNHYKSWVNSKEFPILPIRYEDIESKPISTMRNVINFLIKIGKLDTSFDESKAKKCIENCNFENLKKKEEEEGFKEAPIGQKSGKKIIFFNLGKKNDWKKILPENIKDKMNKIFDKDLKKWGYNTNE